MFQLVPFCTLYLFRQGWSPDKYQFKKAFDLNLITPFEVSKCFARYTLNYQCSLLKLESHLDEHSFRKGVNMIHSRDKLSLQSYVCNK